ncbi:MAG: ribbon-helix-helix protein, CopG family [Solirubrobacterales bacterium]
MAKVMISLPDELLARIDAEAARSGRSRSAVIRDAAANVFAENDRKLAEIMRELNSQVKRSHGGDVVSVLKASRPR